MTDHKRAVALPAQDTRTRILRAAEHLLAAGRAGFSMRDLAAEAEVSFATPFNRFGNKGAIIQALSAMRIARMSERLVEAALTGPAPDRVLAAVDIAIGVMLETPVASRAVMGALGSPAEVPGDVSEQSQALWALAIGEAEGLAVDTAKLARAILPDQLAVAFRGVLSFWSAGEIADGALRVRARQAAAALLLGFAVPDDRTGLTRILEGLEQPLGRGRFGREILDQCGCSGT